jgi:uncharacterized protein (TIGR02444 family)
MAADNRFPSDPFWQYSLAIYAQPDVADACINLQDEFGLDVNLVLACLWSDAEGPGRLDSEHIRKLVNGTRDWQEKVVKPLRGLRRYSKHEPAGVPDDLRKVFRPALQAVELDAEHVEQLIISKTLREFGTRGVNRGNGGDAVQNLLAYLAVQGVARDERVSKLLTTVLTAAFPGADLSPGL